MLSSPSSFASSRRPLSTSSSGRATYKVARNSSGIPENIKARTSLPATAGRTYLAKTSRIKAAEGATAEVQGEETAPSPVTAAIAADDDDLIQLGQVRLLSLQYYHLVSYCCFVGLVAAAYVDG